MVNYSGSNTISAFGEYVKNKIPSSLPANGGNSLTVNGHTVNSDVPYDAVFTDTVYNDAHIISALEGKSGIGHTHSRSEITDFPSALPANGGNANTANTANYANSANYASSANIANSATYANIVKTPYLIGTSSNCAYNTILAWANAQTGTAYASIVAGDGFPSDAPYQNEAMLKVESDYYGARKIVTWTRYMGGQPRLVMIRPIFGTNWNDDQWRA